MINQRLKDVCERIDKLVPGLEQGDLMEYALDKIADHIEKQSAALEFVRQNLSKMHKETQGADLLVKVVNKDAYDALEKELAEAKSSRLPDHLHEIVRARNEDLEKQIQEMRQALEFYAKEHNAECWRIAPYKEVSNGDSFKAGYEARDAVDNIKKLESTIEALEGKLSSCERSREALTTKGAVNG